MVTFGPTREMMGYDAPVKRWWMTKSSDKKSSRYSIYDRWTEKRVIEWEYVPRSSFASYDIEFHDGWDGGTLVRWCLLPFIGQLYIRCNTPLLNRIIKKHSYFGISLSKLDGIWTLRLGWGGNPDDGRTYGERTDWWYRLLKRCGMKATWRTRQQGHRFYILNDWLLGPCTFSQEQLSENKEMLVPMPEGTYTAVVHEERNTWYYPRWHRTRTEDYWKISIPGGGIPYPGKGESDWDCGDDGLASTSIPKKTCRTLGQAIGHVVGTVLDYRLSRGGYVWKKAPEKDLDFRSFYAKTEH